MVEFYLLAITLVHLKVQTILIILECAFDSSYQQLIGDFCTEILSNSAKYRRQKQETRKKRKYVIIVRSENMIDFPTWGLTY